MVYCGVAQCSVLLCGVVWLVFGEDGMEDDWTEHEEKEKSRVKVYSI